MRSFPIAPVALAACAWLAASDCPDGCPKRCPTQTDVQSPYVKEHFDISKFWGVFYEIAFHDGTQPRIWPIKAACQRSVKSPHPDDPTNYKDLFSLNEGPGAGVNAVCDLEFNITEKLGVFMGHWSSTSFWNPNLTSIANTVVDVGVAPNGTYEWTLEFQCREFDDPGKGIRFAAVNFYHRKPVIDQSEFDSMMSRLRARGLGWVADVSPGLTMVDQQKCIDHSSYPALDAKPFLCGQGRQAIAEEVNTHAVAVAETGSCPEFLKPLCDLVNSTECLFSCVPRLGECIHDTDCVDSLKELGLCMADMQRKSASADDRQACLVPDNRLRSNFLYCMMDDPGCLPVPGVPSAYLACRDDEIAGDSNFAISHVLGDWYKVKGWKKGELVECLPCQQVKFWEYSPADPLPWPSPTPPVDHDYTVISSSWHEQDAKGKYWPMNQTSLWGPRRGRDGFPGKEWSIGTMFGIGYQERYTVVHDGSREAEPFIFFYACGKTKQGEYVSGLVLAKTPTVSASLKARIAKVAQEHGFDDGEWCDVDNSCAAQPREIVI